MPSSLKRIADGVWNADLLQPLTRVYVGFLTLCLVGAVVLVALPLFRRGGPNAIQLVVTAGLLIAIVLVYALLRFWPDAIRLLGAVERDSRVEPGGRGRSGLFFLDASQVVVRAAALLTPLVVVAYPVLKWSWLQTFRLPLLHILEPLLDEVAWVALLVWVSRRVARLITNRLPGVSRRFRTKLGSFTLLAVALVAVGGVGASVVLVARHRVAEATHGYYDRSHHSWTEGLTYGADKIWTSSAIGTRVMSDWDPWCENGNDSRGASAWSRSAWNVAPLLALVLWFLIGWAPRWRPGGLVATIRRIPPALWIWVAVLAAAVVAYLELALCPLSYFANRFLGPQCELVVYVAGWATVATVGVRLLRSHPISPARWVGIAGCTLLLLGSVGVPTAAGVVAGRLAFRLTGFDTLIDSFPRLGNWVFLALLPVALVRGLLLWLQADGIRALSGIGFNFRVGVSSWSVRGRSVRELWTMGTGLLVWALITTATVGFAVMMHSLRFARGNRYTGESGWGALLSSSLGKLEVPVVHWLNGFADPLASLLFLAKWGLIIGAAVDVILLAFAWERSTRRRTGEASPDAAAESRDSSTLERSRGFFALRTFLGFSYLFGAGLGIAAGVAIGNLLRGYPGVLFGLACGLSTFFALTSVASIAGRLVAIEANLREPDSDRGGMRYFGIGLLAGIGRALAWVAAFAIVLAGCFLGFALGKGGEAILFVVPAAIAAFTVYVLLGAMPELCHCVLAIEGHVKARGERSSHLPGGDLAPDLAAAAVGLSTRCGTAEFPATHIAGRREETESTGVPIEVERAMAAYDNGDVRRAFSLLSGVPDLPDWVERHPSERTRIEAMFCDALSRQVSENGVREWLALAAAVLPGASGGVLERAADAARRPVRVRRLRRRLAVWTRHDSLRALSKQEAILAMMAALGDVEAERRGAELAPVVRARRVAWRRKAVFLTSVVAAAIAAVGTLGAVGKAVKPRWERWRDGQRLKHEAEVQRQEQLAEQERWEREQQAQLDHQRSLLGKWAVIPAGTFEMGCVTGGGECARDELPRHRVTLTRPFQIMVTEVTVGQYGEFAKASARSQPVPASPETEFLPVTHVTWDDAAAYCQSIGGRLPTEAEWERAARGDRDGLKYPWGKDWRVGAANCDESKVGGTYRKAAVPIGSFAATGFGLVDMAGNVSEWCADWYSETSYASSPASDPKGPESGSSRVLRGGSWFGPTFWLRTSFRQAGPPTYQSGSIGFRCVREAGE